MSDDPLEYRKTIQRVVRDALSYVAEHGLPGDHHFYVAFQTQAEGVDIPPFLVSQFPEEVSIVFQHVFWELEVEDDSFSVTLSFNAVKYRLVVPFAAVTAFTDPHAQFALRLEPEEAAEKETGPRGVWQQEAPETAPAKAGAVETEEAAEGDESDGDDDPAEDKPGREAKIVDFKSFRKRP